MNKNALFMITVFLVLSVCSVNVFAASFKVEEKLLSQRESGLEIKGIYPVIYELGNLSLETAINEKIEIIFRQKIASARESKARSVSFSYTVTESQDVTTILLYSVINTSTSKAEVNSLNFNPYLRKWIGVNDMLGVNGVSLANNVIGEAIRKNPEVYYPSFTGIDQDETFLVEDEGVTFLFDAFKLAPGSEGIVTFTLYFDQIVEITVSRDEYWKNEDSYDIRMIPLRRVLETLGFTVSWYEEDNGVVIGKSDLFTIEISPENNLYIKTDDANKAVSRMLEVAPELLGGITYVPISFFDQLLDNVTYYVNENEDIIFTSYYE